MKRLKKEKNVDVDAILSEMDERVLEKKLTNVCISILILILGVSSFTYGLTLEPSITIFRFMTVDGTLFTTLGALVFIIVNLLEVWWKTEITSPVIYYIRLSSAVAEMVIFIVVMFSQLPVFEEHIPVVDRYDSFVMHVLIPVLGVSSFVLNDSPIGKLTPLKRWNGTWFVSCYAVVIFCLIGRGILPQELIPYFFLDVQSNPWSTTAFAFVFIYGVAYLMAWALSELNRKLSWLWFWNVTKPD